jgi:hypothetical protein
VAIFRHGRNSQNRCLARMEEDSLYLLRIRSRRQVGTARHATAIQEVDCGHGPGSGQAADRPP